MSDIYPEIDDTPHTKHINIFQVKETITSKNEFNEKIHQQPQSVIQHQANTQATQQNKEGKLMMKANVIDKIPTVEKDIKLEEADINHLYFSNKTPPQITSRNLLSINSSFYIHCKQCLLILSAENKLQTENALYYLMSQPIIQNLLQKQKEYNQYSYTELRCRRCELLIGCILIDNSKETSSAYFIKKNIVSKENKQMVFSLLGLRSDLLLKMQNHLCSLFDKSTAIIDISKQTKDSLEKYTYPKERIDVLLIVHKIEGRVFLLGKNGFYNTVINEFNKKHNQNIYFILLFKEIEEKCTEEYYNGMIDDLINKGDQGDLKSFKEANRIICINDLAFDRKKGMFKQIYDMTYTILSDSITIDNNDDGEVIVDVDDVDNGNEDNDYNRDIKSYYAHNNNKDGSDAQNKEDNDILYNFIEYFYEGRNKLFANCLML